MQILLALLMLSVTGQGLATALRGHIQSLVGKKLTAPTAIINKMNEVDEDRRNALHHAVMLGDLPLVEFYLANGVNTRSKDKHGLIPLHYAEQLVDEQPSIERMKIMSLVLEKTFGIDKLDWRGWAPIVWSLMAGDYDRVVELLDRGADVFAGRPRSNGQHAAWAAEHLQDIRAIKVIAESALQRYSGGYLTNRQEQVIDLVASYLQENKLPDNNFIKKFTTHVPDWYYFRAIDKGYLKFAQAMIERGLNPATAKNKDGVNKIMEAAKAGQVEEMLMLINSGVQLDSMILFLAISSGNPELVEIIVKHNVELANDLIIDLMYGRILPPYTISTTIGDVLTGIATDEGKQKIHQIITKEISNAQLPALATIAKLQHLKETTGRHIYSMESLFLIASGEGLNKELREILVYADANTRLNRAVSLGDLELVKQALADGADINHRYGFSKGAVLTSVVWYITHSQRRQDFLKIMTFLLAQGANPNVAINRGLGKDYPIQQLIREKDYQGVKILLDHGADPNQLALATSYAGDSQMIEMLIAYGADVNSNRGQESTPLKAAARRGRADLVLRYLDLGAELDDHDRHRGSAFTQAARHGHLEVVEILKARGARTDIPCYYGGPLEAARKFRHYDVVKFLENH